MRRIALPILILAITLGITACAPSRPSAPVEPEPIRLDTPGAAVQSYLEWVSYSYRVGDPDPASPSMTPSELVRVDAYIERNRQENRGIEQELVSFEQRRLTSTETTALLAGSERWRYRYFSLEPLAYTTEELTASYETTYTLVREPRGWVVDDIDVQPVGDVE